MGSGGFRYTLKVHKCVSRVLVTVPVLWPKEDKITSVYNALWIARPDSSIPGRDGICRSCELSTSTSSACNQLANYLNTLTHSHL